MCTYVHAHALTFSCASSEGLIDLLVHVLACSLKRGQRRSSKDMAKLLVHHLFQAVSDARYNGLTKTLQTMLTHH